MQLKREKLPSNDLVLLYMTCIRSILSYTVPVFYYALPKYLQNDLERVQKRALSIIFLGLAYNKAFEVVDIQTISDYNESICDKTFKYISNNTSHRFRKLLPALTLEALRGAQIDPPPLDFFGFKFLLLDRLPKALAQLFLVCEHIF